MTNKKETTGEFWISSNPDTFRWNGKSLEQMTQEELKNALRQMAIGQHAIGMIIDDLEKTIESQKGTIRFICNILLIFTAIQIIQLGVAFTY